MGIYVVATPLFDSQMAVDSYLLWSRNSERLLDTLTEYWEMSDALKSPELDLLEQVGIEPFAGDKNLFIQLNEYQLLTDVPANTSLPPERTICILPQKMTYDDNINAKCVKLLSLGFRLARHVGSPAEENSPLGELSEYMLVDFKQFNFDALIRLITRNIRRKKVVVSNVPDLESFEKLGGFSNALYSGNFYSAPITKGVRDISPLKVNLLRLLKTINEEDFDLTQIAATVGRDAALSISLLQFINASVSGITRKIDSIRNAVAILGQREVRRWATIAIAVGLGQDRPGEITKLSLVRAKFAENLATAYELGIFAPRLFMAGLFSLLDVILQKPMEKAIKEIAVDHTIRDVLVEKTGPLCEVMDLIYAYERADWDRVSLNMIRNNIDSESVINASIDALMWYRQLLDAIDEQETEAG